MTNANAINRIEYLQNQIKKMDAEEMAWNTTEMTMMEYSFKIVEQQEKRKKLQWKIMDMCQELNGQGR